MNELDRDVVEMHKLPLTLKEGCREAAGWCSRTRSHLIEVAKRTDLKTERFANIKGCFALLNTTPAFRATPPSKGGEFVSSDGFVIHSQVLRPG